MKHYKITAIFFFMLAVLSLVYIEVDAEKAVRHTVALYGNLCLGTIWWHAEK